MIYFMEETEDPTKNRNAFRIDDELIIFHRQATQEDLDIKNLSIEQEIDYKKQVHHIFTDLDHQVAGIKMNLEMKYGELSRYLQTIEKKITVLANAISHGDEKEAQDPKKVNISESGIAFESETEYKEGTHVKIEITLQPTYHVIPTIAKVVKSIKKENGYFTATQFVHMKGADQQALTRHIMRKQSDSLISKK